MKTCLHSVSYSGTWGGQTALTLKQFIAKAAHLGFQSVEFAAKRPHCSPLDIGKQERIEIKRLLKENGLELSCLASYHDFAVFFEHKELAELLRFRHLVCHMGRRRRRRASESGSSSARSMAMDHRHDA